jgi:hypothetical protein
MKYIIINLFLILSASAMDLVTLKEIVSKSPSKEMRSELKTFSEAGEYAVKLKFTIHAQNKTMDLPPVLISNKIVDEKYLVSVMPISETQKFLSVIAYDDKDKVYKKWSADPGPKVPGEARSVFESLVFQRDMRFYQKTHFRKLRSHLLKNIVTILN